MDAESTGNRSASTGVNTVRIRFDRRSEGTTGKPIPRLVLRPDPEDREALLSTGRPYFAARVGRDRLAALLTDDTNWEETLELVTGSLIPAGDRLKPGLVA